MHISSNTGSGMGRSLKVKGPASYTSSDKFVAVWDLELWYKGGSWHVFHKQTKQADKLKMMKVFFSVNLIKNLGEETIMKIMYQN